MGQLKEVMDSFEPRFFNVKISKPAGVSALKLNLRRPLAADGNGVTQIIAVSEVDPIKWKCGENLDDFNWGRADSLA